MNQQFMKRALSTVGMLILGGIVLAACSNASSSDSKQPDSSATLDGPAATMTLFEQRCVSCHATDLKGRMEPETNLTKIGTKMTQEEIVEQITNGGSRMPAFKKMLTSDEIQDIAVWLATKK